MTQQVTTDSPVLKTGIQAPKQPALPPVAAEADLAPSVFGYTDYRSFLKDAYEHRRKRNPAFTESAFVRKAGLSSNSRGYFKLIVQGKRNLNPKTTRAFSDALDLTPKESLYFETLVHFNHADKPRDKHYYFERLMASAEGAASKQFELVLSQYSYYSCWYLVAVRELVGLAVFNEDPAWIASQLRDKITQAQAVEAMAHLERLEMIRRNPKTGRWEQTDPLVKFAGNAFAYAITKFQSEMLKRTQESLAEDPFEQRRASSLTISCDRSRMPEMIQMVDEFRDAFNVKFGMGSQAPDAVFQVGFQICQLTPVPQTPNRPKKQAQIAQE